MKATIEFSGMIHMIKTFEGEYPEDVIDQLERVQDLDCLVRMGPDFGDDVTGLRSFLNRYHSGELTWEDIGNMNFELNIGSIKCIDIQE